ncbi:hypothetical protein PH7735_02649 [Shimia thalassica]|uniref:Uncharacterized protein n=1 Tax=Shimia thalassica TaxID=1715693 RepID=A0A0N7M9S4_9RHOB|nr:hypothetical protein PH7735_02649 [Shimia thalassica]
MPTTACAKDFRRLVKQRVPKMFYDFAESESHTDLMFHSNPNCFQKGENPSSRRLRC